MKKAKIQVIHDWFIPWMFEDYDNEDIADAWGSGDSIEDYCMGCAGLLPVQHIANWDDIKHHFDAETYEGDEINYSTGKPYASWSEYYEEDGYVHDPFFNGIPNTLEIEWVSSDTIKEVQK